MERKLDFGEVSIKMPENGPILQRSCSFSKICCFESCSDLCRNVFFSNEPHTRIDNTDRIQVMGFGQNKVIVEYIDVDDLKKMKSDDGKR